MSQDLTMRIELCTTRVECFNSPRSRARSGVAGAERAAETEARRESYDWEDRSAMMHGKSQKWDVNADR